LDTRNATFSSTLSAANTAGLNPAIGTLLLGNVTLAPRDVAPAASGNANTTFSTSAQRGLQSLSLTTSAVPAAALALPALINLTLAAPAPTQQLELSAGSLWGQSALAALTISNINNVLWLPTAPPTLVLLDLSGNSITAVEEHDFDGMRALRWLSLADNPLDYVSDAAFSAAKQPVLPTIDQSRTPLTSSSGCRPGSRNKIMFALVGGAPYVACSACPAGWTCSGGASSPLPCGTNMYAAGGAAACTPCPAGTYAPSAAKECVGCPPRLAAPACNATASWRDTITIVAEGAGGWINVSIYLLPAELQPPATNVPCGLLTVLDATTVSCTLPFLLPAASNAPVLTFVWVAHAGTGGVLQRLNTTVTLVPPPPLVIAPGGGLRLAPHTPGTGRIVLRLPSPRLAASDWDAAGLQPPTTADIDAVEAWVDGMPCTDPLWESDMALSCVTSTTNATGVAAVVQLAGGAFNVTGVLASLLLPFPALAANTELQLLPPSSAPHSAINITLAGVALCTGGSVPQLATASVAGVPCTSVACVASLTTGSAALCVGWNASHPAVDTLRRDSGPQVTVNVTVAWANPAYRPVTCHACVVLATRPVLVSITPASISSAGVPVVVSGTGFSNATRAPPTVLIGDEVCSDVVVLTPGVVQCTAPALLSSTPGYPAVAVVVINAVGVASNESVSLTYPAVFNVTWTSTPELTIPAGDLLPPALTLQVLSREAATCTLAMNVTSCATPDPSLASRPAGMAVSTAAAVAVPASGSPSAVTRSLLLDQNQNQN